MELESVSLPTNLSGQAALGDLAAAKGASNPTETKSAAASAQPASGDSASQPKTSDARHAAYQVTLSITSQMRAMELAGETPSQIASTLDVPESEVDSDLGIAGTASTASTGLTGASSTARGSTPVVTSSPAA